MVLAGGGVTLTLTPTLTLPPILTPNQEGVALLPGALQGEGVQGRDIVGELRAQLLRDVDAKGYIYIVIHSYIVIKLLYSYK